MKRIAVVGSGISGMAAAYYLSRSHEVWLFEQDARVGGHTHTVVVETPAGPLPVDTGFIVYNERNYPNLVRLFAELGVETQPSDMSFSVSCRRRGFEYSSRGLRGFLGGGRYAFAPSQYRLLAEVLRFHRLARRLVAEPDGADWSLEEFLERHRFGAAFRRDFLYPMASAIWSASLSRIGEFPVRLLVRFFDNHGLLRVTRNLPWRVVRGGSHRYIPALTAPYRDRIVTGAAVAGVTRREDGVDLRIAGRPTASFDEVVLACHGPQSLALIDRPTEDERRVLGSFRTTMNETWLHTDGSILPRRASVRASWNYHLDAADPRGARVTYHMNRLQSLATDRDYCVTLQPEGLVDERAVVRRMAYAHPQYSLESLGAQQDWGLISGRRRTHYCGAYWFNGFHEDGLKSALRVARALGVPC